MTATLFEASTPEEGKIRLSDWDGVYVLWYHGEMVWSSDADMLQKITCAQREFGLARYNPSDLPRHWPAVAVQK